jgi:hypothetical protein
MKELVYEKIRNMSNGYGVDVSGQKIFRGRNCLPQDVLVVLVLLAHCLVLLIIQRAMLLTAAPLRRPEATLRKVSFLLVSALVRSSIPAQEDGPVKILVNSG